MSRTSLQLPAAATGVTAGLAQYVETAGVGRVAAGVDGCSSKSTMTRARAKSDAQNALRLDLLEPLLRRLSRSTRS